MNENYDLHAEIIYEDIIDINIKSLNHNIILEHTDDNDIKIYYDNNIQKDLTIKIHNDTLTVKGTSHINIFNFFKRKYYSDIFIYIPKKLYNIIIKDMNANINITLENIDQLNIKDINGNIFVKTGTLSSLNINDVNGNTEIIDVNVDNIIINDINGNIKSNYIEALDTMICDVNGNITLFFNDKSENYNLTKKTLFTSQTIDNNAPKNITIKSVTGNANIYFED